jgi:methanogenic corrinoid protein MtbC1
MKTTENKGPEGFASRQDAEVDAFRALVSSYFDNSLDVSDTDTRLASAPDAAWDDLEDQGHGEDGVDSTFQNDPRDGTGSNIHLSPQEVEALATRALKVLAAAPEAGRETPLAQLLALTEAYIGLDESARHDMLARIMGRGVSSADVIEAVVPAAARYMGELWATDKLSFAEVTIGAARLQETVRTIGTRKAIVAETEADAPCILLVVPRIEQHTLGIFVLAEQFRRMGVRIHMTLGNNQAEILRLVRLHRFAMVGITASSRRTLASVQDLVKTIRTGVPRITPIVVGGPVTGLNLDIRSLTGADHVAETAEEALNLCGLETTRQLRLES